MGKLLKPSVYLMILALMLAVSSCAVDSYGATPGADSAREPSPQLASIQAAESMGLTLFGDRPGPLDVLPKIYQKDFAGMVESIQTRFAGKFEGNKVYVSLVGAMACISYGSGIEPNNFHGATACQRLDLIITNPLFIGDQSLSTALFLVPDGCQIRGKADASRS